MQYTERLLRATVLWLWEEQQASFAEIAVVLGITREKVGEIYKQAKAERERILAIHAR